ncbi:MAG: hypothetical protein IPH45_17930 [Bacteroidales bacterium]|nr:hypothetical protein [Bacteroidales bacterium]
MEPLLNVFTEAGGDFSVTLLKNSDCTIDALKKFEDYGYIIIDTHGKTRIASWWALR